MKTVFNHRLLRKFGFFVSTLASIQSLLPAASNSEENSRPFLFPIEGDNIDLTKVPLPAESGVQESLQSIDWEGTETHIPIAPPMPISTVLDLEKAAETRAKKSPGKKVGVRSTLPEAEIVPVVEYEKETSEVALASPEEQPAEEIVQAAPLNNTPAPDTEQLQTPPPSTTPVQQQTIVPPSDNQPLQEQPKTILINFSNVSIIEYIRFISRISGKNFIFDETDLQFNVTIISEEPTTIENVMTALLQELRIHDLVLLEEGNNIVIHRNPKVSAISTVVGEGITEPLPKNAQLITQVFRLNTVDPKNALDIIKPLVSDSAILEILKDSRNLIVTDLASNIAEIAKLLKSVDSPISGLVIGQYVVKNMFPDNLLSLAEKVIGALAGDQPLTLVPHSAANSILIISSPYLVEKSISVLQNLDQTTGSTQLFNPAGYRENAGGRWELDSQGNWIFRPATTINKVSSQNPPDGVWTLDPQGNWYFDTSKGGLPNGALQRNVPGEQAQKGPKGQWILNPQGLWIYQLSPGESIAPQILTRPAKAQEELPPGHLERTQFYVYKLKYRKGDQIEQALTNISTSLSQTGNGNQDLISTINSVQWLEASNSLVFTGTSISLNKVKGLIEEIDTPLRQVFIEMLILQTTVADSLEYGVNWSTRFGGGNTSGAQAFLTGASTLPGAMNTAGVGLTPNASSMAVHPQFNLGIIGQHLTHGGTQFNSVGALVSALHDNNRIDIIMNPKILVEDNTAAEIFVGVNTPFQSQAISNDRGTVITNNFEFRDVGTRLKVTPLIGSNDIITLNIIEEVSSIVSGTITAGQTTNNQPGPTTNLNTTTTTVHIPNGYFLILSGMLQDTDNRTRNQLPCLGGLPFLGAAFSHKRIDDNKANLMIFLRPLIIDSEEEIDNITKHQQDIFKYKNRIKPMWEYEVDEALDFFNIIDTTYEAEDQELK